MLCYLIVDFETIWANIVMCEGQTFATSTGQPFTYDVRDDGLAIRRSDLFLAREEISNQYRAGIASGGKGQMLAYINAILKDSRIRS